MALVGNINSDFGAIAGYHNIGYFSWDKTGSLNILVHSFVDEAARLAGNRPLISQQLNFSNILTNNAVSLTDLYNLLKAEVQFSGMLDG